MPRADKITLHDAKKADYPAIRQITNQKENRPGLGFVSKVVFDEFAEKQKHERRYILVVAKNSAGKIIGFVRALTLKNKSQTTIHEICRDIHARGQGVGEKLLSYVEKASRMAGVHSVFLKTPDGIPANRAYLRHGFNMVAKETPKDNPRLKRTLNHYQKRI